MRGFARRFWGALSSARYKVVARTAHTPQEMLRLAYWADKTSLRIDVPVAMLRTQGGFTYGDDHPFVRGLSEGEAVLRRFYDGFAPTNLAEVYGVDSDLPPWRLPWRLHVRPAPPPGEKGLSAGHGLAFWGPCSDQKVALEARRLRQVAQSISAKGFDPDRHGDIEGHLLTDGERCIFFVMGGKHRAAALVQAGHSHIPVRFRNGRMRVIDCRAVDDWPMVAAKEVSREAALGIAEIYLRGRGLSDVLPGKGRDVGK